MQDINLIYEKYSEIVYKYIFCLTGDKDTIEESIEENFYDKEKKKQLFKKIQDFDEETKNVMYLRILGEFEYKEIAEIMNKTPNWARVVFFRGKQKLKEELKDEK